MPQPKRPSRHAPATPVFVLPSPLSWIERESLFGMDEFEQALATLELEATSLESIPTRPWPRGLFLNLMAAFLLPVFLWLVPYVLQKVLR